MEIARATALGVLDAITDEQRKKLEGLTARKPEPEPLRYVDLNREQRRMLDARRRMKAGKARAAHEQLQAKAKARKRKAAKA